MQETLIVDYSDVIRTELKVLLLKGGFEVAPGASDTEGLQAATDNGPFDLVIRDCSMPGLKGIEKGIRAWLVKPIDTDASKKVLSKLSSAKAA